MGHFDAVRVGVLAGVSVALGNCCVSGNAREQDSVQRHALRRSEWVAANAPHLGEGVPVHTVYISAFQGGFGLEELDAEGSVCCADMPRGRGSAFGTTEEVVPRVTELSTDDPWVVEVGRALARERGWKAWGSGWGRRAGLEVRLGHGQMFHVSASSDRESILRYGLDWRRMGPATGVAGGGEPRTPRHLPSRIR